MILECQIIPATFTSTSSGFYYDVLAPFSVPSSGRNNLLQTVYECCITRSGVAGCMVLFVHGKLRRESKYYCVYVYGVSAACIERLRCGSGYKVYIQGGNGAYMEKKVWDLPDSTTFRFCY